MSIHNGLLYFYLTRWESGSKEGLEYVVVDPEWGAFGDNGSIDFIKTGKHLISDSNNLLVDFSCFLLFDLEKL